MSETNVPPAAARAQFQSTWRDNASDAHGFGMERCQGYACTNFARVASIAANVIAFTDNGLLTRTRTYRVRAFNSHSNSEYSLPHRGPTWLTSNQPHVAHHGPI